MNQSGDNELFERMVDRVRSNRLKAKVARKKPKPGKT
jgi:hypothetical protein